MLSFVILNAVLLNVVMLNIVMPNINLLSVKEIINHTKRRYDVLNLSLQLVFLALSARQIFLLFLALIQAFKSEKNKLEL